MQTTGNEKLAKIGLELFRSLFALLKTASLYEVNNNRYLAQAEQFRHLVAEILTDEATITFACKDGHFFLNDERIRLETTDEEAATYFREKFAALDVSGITIFPRADSREIDRFIYALVHFKPPADPDEVKEALRDRLERLQIENIVPIRVTAKSADKKQWRQADTEAARVRARKTFFKAMGTVQEIVTQAKKGSRINLAKTKRTVQALIDQIIEDEAAMIELTVLRDFDEYTYIHSVNVCVLSLVMGFHLGLDKKRLADLGVAALLHDLGKINLPIELVNKPTEYDEMDWQMMRQHPIFGAKTILRTRGADPSSARAVATAYEHHITYNCGGYPELLQKRPPCLFAQIVAICDTFNAMMSGRVYHKQRLPGDQVITSMVNRAGTDFNPLLLKVFINVIGIYPVGSVVRLTTDEIAIVSRTNSENLDRPEVKVIADRQGPRSEVKVIDLSKEDIPDIRIASVIDGEKYGIDPAAFIDLG